MTSQLQKNFYQQITSQLRHETLEVSAAPSPLEARLAGVRKLLKRTSLAAGALMVVLSCHFGLELTSFVTELVNQQDVLQF